MMQVAKNNQHDLFKGINLRLARNCHNYTLGEVGDAVGKSRQFIHRLETGADTPTAELAESLAEYLEVLPGFFFDASGMMIVEDAYHFRKRATTKVAIKQSALAKGEMFRRFVLFVDSKLKLPVCSFSSIEANTPTEIERAAEKCRVDWGLGVGPIDNMVRVAENAGAVVTTFHDVSREVDALSFWSSRPVIVTNNAKGSACRIRFDLAHEIGHFILHEGKTTGDRLTEAEANRFAGAFLLPRSTFVKEFPITRGQRLNWAGIGAMKLRWKVSKAAILYRARQLDIISESQYKSGIIMGLRRGGEAIVEEFDDMIDYEEPELIYNALKLLKESFGLTFDDVSHYLNMKTSFVKHFLPQSALSEDPVTPPPNSSSILNLDHYRNRKVFSL
jgi:Zn-dependent peptidase ImmA (M78 family)/transcriptional regulator with XRE-family HTH domain